MRIRSAVAVIAASICVPTVAFAQPTTGTYSYFWSLAGDATNTPVTSVNVVPGQTVSVRFWLKETGGQALTATNTYGLGGYDASFTWAVGGSVGNNSSQGIFITKIDGTNSATVTTTDVQVNPLSYGSRGFNNTSNGVIPTNADATSINTARSLQLAKTVGNLADPAQYVKVTDGPNSAGQMLLSQMTFTTATGFTGDTLTGAQRGGTNFVYYVNSGNPLALDSLIGTNNAVLQFTPVPEPGTSLVVVTGAVGLAAWVRRWRASRTEPSAVPIPA
jgi:hypothetical protein